MKNTSLQMKHANQYFVYLVCCANGTLYVGYTKNVERRVAQHNAGRGGRYTRICRPVSLIATWSFGSRSEAQKAERELKRLSPERKLARAALTGPGLENTYADTSTGAL